MNALEISRLQWYAVKKTTILKKGEKRMPEAYTHVRVACAAFAAQNAAVPCSAALSAGAGGPDPFYAYQAWRKRKDYPLHALADQMHNERCGAFLLCLLQHAVTKAQRQYTLGFLSHYAADCLFHPYVEAQCSSGGDYCRASGHGFCEQAMDTYFYAMDMGKVCVEADDCAPRISAPEMSEIAALLRTCIQQVYGAEIPVAVLCDAFHTYRFGHCVLRSGGGGKKLVAGLAEKLLGIKNGALRCHITPGEVPKGGFAAVWQHPYTKIEVQADPNRLYASAVRRTLGYFSVAEKFWQGNTDTALAAHLLGDYSYETGQPALK